MPGYYLIANQCSMFAKLCRQGCLLKLIIKVHFSHRIILIQCCSPSLLTNIVNRLRSILVFYPLFKWNCLAGLSVVFCMHRCIRTWTSTDRDSNWDSCSFVSNAACSSLPVVCFISDSVYLWYNFGILHNTMHMSYMYSIRRYITLTISLLTSWNIFLSDKRSNKPWACKIIIVHNAIT